MRTPEKVLYLPPQEGMVVSTSLVFCFANGNLSALPIAVGSGIIGSVGLTWLEAE